MALLILTIYFVIGDPYQGFFSYSISLFLVGNNFYR